MNQYKIIPVIRPWLSCSIYKLSSPNTEYTYYGATTDSLARCLSKHKTHYTMWKANKYNYLKCFQIVSDTDCKIELLEEFRYTELCQKKEKVKQYIDADNNSVNSLEKA